MKIRGRLTTHFLKHSVSPYLDALANLQHTIDEIKGTPLSAVSIQEISSEEVDATTRGMEYTESQISQSAPTYEEATQALRSLKELVETLDSATSNAENLRSETLRQIVRDMEVRLHEYTNLINEKLRQRWQWYPSEAITGEVVETWEARPGMFTVRVHIGRSPTGGDQIRYLRLPDPLSEDEITHYIIERGQE